MGTAGREMVRPQCGFHTVRAKHSGGSGEGGAAGGREAAWAEALAGAKVSARGALTCVCWRSCGRPSEERIGRGGRAVEREK